ncbi:uncharacterized protein [Panulirus ornatus]
MNHRQHHLRQPRHTSSADLTLNTLMRISQMPPVFFAREEAGSPEFVTYFSEVRGQEPAGVLEMSISDMYQDINVMATGLWTEQEVPDDSESPAYSERTPRLWDDHQDSRQGRLQVGEMNSGPPDEGRSRRSGRQHRGQRGAPGGTPSQWDGQQEGQQYDGQRQLDQLVSVPSRSPSLYYHLDAAFPQLEPSVGNSEGSGTWDSQK